MTAVIQRVHKAAVTADGEPSGKCEKGLLILLGVLKGDCERDAEVLAAKISKLRIFSDENDKMNLSVNDVEGGAVVVSNFTLGANYAHGNRPDYLNSEVPERANELYMYFTQKLRSLVPGGVETGVFGAYMNISVECDGPITIVMDSKVLKK